MSSFGGGAGGFGAQRPLFGAAPTAPSFGAPQATTPFGAPTQSSVFGAPAPQQPSLFGAPQNTTPSLFGASAPAATSAFGAPAPAAAPAPTPATSLFAAPATAPSQSLFGAPAAPSGGGLFGASTSAFASQGFGAPAASAPSSTGLFGGAAPAAASSGTTSSKYQITTEYGTGPQGGTDKYVSISLMPQYRSRSVEELRLEDYRAGVKGKPAGVAGTGLFGSATAGSTTFGFSSAAPSTSLFGAGTSAPFGGATAQPSSSGLFGAPASSAPAFSQPAATGGFGANAGGGGLFGNPASASGTALFGSTPGGASSGTALFGGASQPAAAGGLFTAKPAGGGFGSAPTTTNLFGAQGSTVAAKPLFGPTTSALGGTGLFGSAPATAGAGFGAPQPATGLFGPAAQQTTPAATGGLFGGVGAKPPAVGLGATQPALALPSFGAGTSLFGNPAAPATGGFGLTPGSNLPGATTSGISAPALAPGGFNFGISSTAPVGTGATPAQPMQAGIASNPFGNQPLFASAQPQPLSGTTPAITAAVPPAAAQSPAAGAVALSAVPVGSRGTPSSATTSPLYRRTPRSIARVRPRGLGRRAAGLGGGAVSASLFEATPVAPTFSPDQFLTGGASKEGSGAEPSASVKKLVIDPSPVRERRQPATTYQQPGNVTASPASDPPSAARASKLGVTPNGIGESSPLTTPAANGNGREVTPLRPRPRRMTAQYFPGEPSPSQSPTTQATPAKVYATYREFYNDNIYPIESEEGNAISSTAAPQLTRDGYYTLPPMATLRTMSLEDLASVDNFTVGRKDLGEVQWIGTTNVSALNLDQIVFIEPREVIVYQDDNSKPSEGSELNKPAIVTLHKIWKMAKSTGRPVTDPSAEAKFVEKLKTQCEEDNTKFLSYEAKTGTWRFEVRHFSRYGLAESDEDDEEDVRGGDHELGPRQPPVVRSSGDRQGRFIAPPAYSDDEGMIETDVDHQDGIDDDELFREERARMEQAELEAGTGASRVTPMDPLLVSLEVPRIQQVHRAIFEDGVPAEKENFQMVDDIPKANGLLSGRWRRSVRSRTVFTESRVDQSSQPIPVGYGSLPLRTPMCDSVVKSDLTRSVVDAGLQFSRSYRMCFGPGGRVFIPSSLASRALQFVVRETRLGTPFRDSLETGLSTHCQAWLASRAQGNPHILEQCPNLVESFSASSEAANQVLERHISQAEKCGVRHQEVVFRLLWALYGRLLGHDEIPSMVVRSRLTEWLRDHACEWWSQEMSVGKGGLDEVFCLLAGGKVDNATLALINLGDLRFASMVGRAMEAPGTDLRKDCGDQLKILEQVQSEHGDWERRLQIVRMLSGEVEPLSRVMPLSWYHVFGMHFWYGRGAECIHDDDAGIAASVDAFELTWAREMCETTQNFQHIGTAPPVAPYLASSLSVGEQRERISLSRDALDTAFLLLCLYGNTAVNGRTLEHALSPCATTNECLDYRLGWHLFSVLTAVAPDAANIYRPERLHCSFAEQLEAAGSPLWAVYVLACTPVEAPGRCALLQDTLCRLWPELEESQVSLGGEESLGCKTFLRKILGVPNSWIHQAEAVWERHRRRCTREADHLVGLASSLEDERYDSALVNSAYALAHEVVCDELVPRVLTLRSRYADSQWVVAARFAQRLLGRLAVRREAVPDWRFRGSVLAEVLTMMLDGIPPAATSEWAHDLALRGQEFRRLGVESSTASTVATLRVGAETDGGKQRRTHCAQIVCSTIALVQRRLVVELSGGGKSLASIGKAMETAVRDLVDLQGASSLTHRLAGEYSGDVGGAANPRRWLLPDVAYSV